MGVPGNVLEPGLVDLHQISPLPPVAPPPDDSWEWDETDMTITEPQEEDPDLMHNLPFEPNLPLDGHLSNGNQPNGNRTGVTAYQSHEMMTHVTLPPNNNKVYQVYSLHSVELYRQPPFPSTSSVLHKTKSGKRKQHILLKSLSKDSSFSSIESLPDILGGLMPPSQGGNVGYRDGESGRGSGQSASSRRSESESGIVSDTGDTETTTTTSEIQEEDQGEGDEDEEGRKYESVEGSHLGLHKDGGTRYNQRTKREESTKEKVWRREDIKRNREDEKRRKHRRGEAVEILINGRGILTPADSDSDFEVGGPDFTSHSDFTGFKVDLKATGTPPALRRQTSSPVLSQSSSLESLLALGGDLFPSKDQLHRSASLESCLVPCRSGEDTGGSMASLGELDLGHNKELDGGEPGKEKMNKSARGEPSSGELSRRTLDLLKRLENIQSPLVANMTRSVSDMTLRSSSNQRSRVPASPSLGGRHSPLSGILRSSRKGPPSLINESSATASLTELSSNEDSSLGSEDCAMLGNQRHLFLDPTMPANANSGHCCYRKQCQGHGRGGQGMDEADAASLSLVVNVSCKSACTDEDEDDSDLLSSSTLTLTEEELGVRDEEEEEEEEEEERLSGASSGNDDDEEEMEGSYVLGLEYMKRELQSWFRFPRTSSSSSSSKTEAGLRDELQCGTNLTSAQNKEQHCFQNRSKCVENNSNNKTKRDNKDEEEEEKNRRNATRSYISQFVDDVENGNVDQSCLKGKDEDDELLREEASVFTKKGESLRESYMFAKTEEADQDVGDWVKTEATKQLSPSPSCDLSPFLSKTSSSLVGQLRGELPCQSSSIPTPPSLSPVENCISQDALHNSRPETKGRKAITSQEKFKFSSFVTEETKREVRDKESSRPPKKRHDSHSSCCDRLPSSLHPRSEEEGKKDSVHDFVREIIDMTSLALKSKENRSEEPNENRSVPDQSPASAKIKNKILEHSHRPLHLRKGDFYSYLSLSSHDSDCGEVSECSEDRNPSPTPYDIPSYVTPTQGLHSPDLFTSTRQQLSNSAPSSRQTSPGFESRKNFCALDLKSGSPSISLPASPEFRDEETLFSACTEEVYLGPPLCYSMELTKKPPRFLLKENLDFLPSLDYDLNSVASLPRPQQLHDKPGDSQVSPSEDRDHLYFQQSTEESLSSILGPFHVSFSSYSSLQGPGSKPKADNPSSLPPAGDRKRGEDPNLLCDVAGGEEVVANTSVILPREERSRNEGSPYLNPRVRVGPIDSSADQCLADTETLKSNMGAVMTKISVCGSATNPSKEPATATTTRINPKINRSLMREADREEGERRGEVDTRRVRRGGNGSQQEGRTVTEKQVTSTFSKVSEDSLQYLSVNPCSKYFLIDTVRPRYEPVQCEQVKPGQLLFTQCCWISVDISGYTGKRMDLCIGKKPAEKFSLQQTVEDCKVHETHRMTFRQ
ncbi:A-kinase anchor protein 6, partial [Notothenia coriiceps]|uniref:A-kinase anchor protein 6 n=1 Tax=Notothenia coriiceps TaxID=8208 RepID=A0A6I9Q2H5_9TELE